MNRRVVFLSASVALLLMSVAGYAQERQRQGGPGRGMGMGMGAGILRVEAVQKELALTEEQVKKVTEVLEAGRSAGGERPNFQDMTDEERQKFREEMEKRTAEQEKKFKEILDEKQQTRLKQIRLQSMGTMALAGGDAAKELGITEEQQGKLRDAMQELMQGAQGDRTGLRDKMTAKAMEILTDEQKAKYKEMLGEPFDVSQLRRGGPGGPGGGRRGN